MCHLLVEIFLINFNTLMIFVKLLRLLSTLLLVLRNRLSFFGQASEIYMLKKLGISSRLHKSLHWLGLFNNNNKRKSGNFGWAIPKNKKYIKKKGKTVLTPVVIRLIHNYPNQLDILSHAFKTN